MAENGIMSDFFARDEPSFRHRRIRRIRRIWLSCPNPGRQRPSWKCRSRRRHRRCFEMLWIGSSSRILQKSFRMFFSNVVHAFFTCWGLLRPVYFHLFSFSLRQLGLTCRIPSYATPRPRNWRLVRSSRRSTARLDTGEMCRGFTDPNFVFVMIGWHVLELVDLLTLCICGIWFKCRTWCYNRCKLSGIFIWASFQIPLWRHKVACNIINIRSHKPSQTSPFHLLHVCLVSHSAHLRITTSRRLVFDQLLLRSPLRHSGRCLRMFDHLMSWGTYSILFCLFLFPFEIPESSRHWNILQESPQSTLAFQESCPPAL
jgi:hypothetical protein